MQMLVLSGAMSVLSAGFLAMAPRVEAAVQKAPAATTVAGRWNLSVTGTDGVAYPSWVEITAEGATLTGRICGRFGSAHPLKRIEWDGKQLILVEAAKVKGADAEKLFVGKVGRGKIAGEIKLGDEPVLKFVATRAPVLKVPAKPKWGKPVALITQGLSGWRLRSDQHPGCWSVADGVLVNKKPCTDIISDNKYQNFKLHLEFKLGEPKANSGVFVRGRYEVQIEDSVGRAPENQGMGGVYGLLAPKINASKKEGEWQSYDITVLGRKLTVVLNGETVIDGDDIPGPTGGALDSDEAQPGPLMLQGDHGVVSFRNITITPAS